MKKLFFNLMLLAVALHACRQPSSKKTTDWTTYRIAYHLFNIHPDSAFYYFNQVAVNSRDSLQVALAYDNMAKIQYRAGDYYGSQESALSALKMLNEHRAKDSVYLTNVYSDLGLARSDLKDQDGALDFYRKALQFTHDPYMSSMIRNDLAFALQQQKKYAEAIRIYNELLNRKNQPATEYARQLTNLTMARWLAKPDINVAPTLLTALKIRQKASDRWGENSSFAHLADYYQAKDLDSAYYFAKAMYTVARQLRSPDDQLEALNKMILSCPAAESARLFRQYTQLNDSVQTARNAAKNQFALIRYNVEKSKADNLQLQQENTQKKYQVAALMTTLVFVALGSGYWLRNRKQKSEKEKQIQLQENRRKMSKTVHDTVANDVYRIMKKVQHDTVPDKEWLLASMSEVYERSRDISYEIVRIAENDYAEQIRELMNHFASGHTDIVLVGNSSGLWQKVNPTLQFELKYILQELMVNMQKHSCATHVTVKFEIQDQQLRLAYFDNGIGFPDGVTFRNGLTNTGTRIKALHGEITFDTGESKGLAIDLVFPIA